MKVINSFTQGDPEWFEYRRGKISGTMLGDIYSKRGGRKIGFYEVIAQRLGIEPDEEDRMERGLRLEEEAISIFEKDMHKKTEVVGICVSDFSKDIINSPDRLIKNKDKYTEAVEVKCLSSARHLQAYIEKEIPSEFESQKLQYFICNSDLQTLFFVFYDPRISSIPYFVLKVYRKDIEEQIELFKNYELEALKEIDRLTEQLAF